MSAVDNTLAIILANESGDDRLNPLNHHRAKAAIPYGGKYRLVDFTLTNCLHSKLRRILLLTQYKSHSLHKHIRDGWSVFNPELGEYITLLPPQMRTGQEWYRGQSDAIYQNLYILDRSKADIFLVLHGEHIYRMDYEPLIQSHIDNQAELTMATMIVDIDQASQFGIVGTDETNLVTRFHEKTDKPWPVKDNDRKAEVSIGIYVFTKEALFKALEKDHETSASTHEIGADIVPRLIRNQRTYAYRFGSNKGRVSKDGYWRDIGDIDSFYQSNMDLLKPESPINLYQEDWPIRSYSGQYPPARTIPGPLGNEGIAINSIINNGSVISGANVQESILFHNVKVGDEAQIQRSILFEGVSVGEGCQIQNTIIEKGVVIPPGTIIGYDQAEDQKRFHITEKGRIVVVPKYTDLS